MLSLRQSVAEILRAVAQRDGRGFRISPFGDLSTYPAAKSMKKFPQENFEKHICVDILVFNKLGELALQKRALDDKSFPEYWDFSASGHINPGEKSIKAAEREVLEELGINPSLVFIKKKIFHYPSWNPNITREVDADIYKAIYDGEFKIDYKEVNTISFFKLEKIQKMIYAGEKIHPEFILAWKMGVITEAARI